MKNDVLAQIKGGLVVSCQALLDEPLCSPFIMGRMALAVKEGGAVGIRANGREDIVAIKEQVNLPLIGIVKKDYPTSEVYITPTIIEVDEVVAAGSDIVAIDATKRKRPCGSSVKDFISEIREKYPNQWIMADVSTYEEGMEAAEYGVHIVATTLSGYTPYSKQLAEPDFDLIKSLSDSLSIPVIAEGRIGTPEQAVKCLEFGAFAVVVGSAITRPQLITKTFTGKISSIVY